MTQRNSSATFPKGEKEGFFPIQNTYSLIKVPNGKMGNKEAGKQT